MIGSRTNLVSGVASEWWYNDDSSFDIMDWKCTGKLTHAAGRRYFPNER
jgi:hypothetical protein